METVECKCGCGEVRPRFDSRGRERLYIAGHQNRTITEKQRITFRHNMIRVRSAVPWNKGKTYTHESKATYANKGSWNKAMRRVFPNECMRCGWSEGPCDTHHIIPRSEGGKYTINNGIILCPNCHRLADVGVLTKEELRQFKL